MRDWAKAFLPASFKGARFHIDREGEGEDGGRRTMEDGGVAGGQ